MSASERESGPTQAAAPGEPWPPARPRNASKARVVVGRHGGRAAVVKSLEGRRWWSRALGRWMLRREAVLLRRLDGFAHAPTLLDASRDRIVMTREGGATLRRLGRQGLEPPVMVAVRRAVEALHAAGVAHGDLGPRDILVDDGGRVVLLDFATAVGPGRPRGLWRLLLPVWKARDVDRVERLARRYARRHGHRQERTAGEPA